ncbi:MAG: hypothetical protein QXO30_04415 [Candidatus Caldarchaeum sp.]
MKIIPLAVALLAVASVSAQPVVPGVGFSSALELSPGTYSFYLGRGEIHFFKVVLEPGDVVVVMLRMAANQDFDLYLLNPLRELAEQSRRGPGATDAVEHVAAERGPYYVVVRGFGESGTYTLTVSVLKPKIVTQTVTATVTQRITETQTVVNFQTNTVMSEKLATVVDARVVEVERVPWTALGLAVLGAALLYTGYATSDALKNLARKQEKTGEGSQQPVSDAAG